MRPVYPPRCLQVQAWALSLPTPDTSAAFLAVLGGVADNASYALTLPQHVTALDLVNDVVASMQPTDARSVMHAISVVGSLTTRAATSALKRQSSRRALSVQRSELAVVMTGLSALANTTAVMLNGSQPGENQIFSTVR